MKSKNPFFTFFLITIFLVLFFRLTLLQVVEGKKYRQLAEENRVQKIKIPGPRGVIFDRHGEILAKNSVVFKVKEKGKEKTISRDEALELQVKSEEKNLFLSFLRDYPQGSVFAHTVGYLGEASEEEIKNSGLEIGDWVGRTGVEDYYEEELRGRDGGELVEVDTLGKILRRIGKEEAIPGKNLNLAIDADLQRIAARQLTGRKGAVIATNPQNGEVLLLYSSPSFDPNYFVGKRSEEVLKSLIFNKVDRPLINRVIAGLYPPGSTFKIVSSAAGLEEKKITPSTLINDPGVITVGQYRYANWLFTSSGRTEGEINVVRAIKRSTDTFFYKVGEMVGANKLISWARKFNLDKISGLDLKGEIAGFIPSPEWKEKVKGEAWFLGNTYHLAIGQGDLALTPLGVNLMTGVIANGGRLCRPRMVKTNSDKKAENCLEIGLKKETVEVIRQGMMEACSEGGTAASFVNFKPQVACKTGTAEYVENDKTRTHAWFTVMAPSNDPTIVLTVLVEGGGEGSSVAAPIAKEILTEYFKER